MKRKVLSILLVIGMILSTMPFTGITVSAGGGGGVMLIDTDGVTVIDDTYNTVQEAIDEATAGQIVRLCADFAEDITVSEEADIILDLNGFALSSDGGISSYDSTIKNSGTLTVRDGSNKTNTHYFKVGSNGAWTLDDYSADAVAYEDLTEAPAENTIIAVKGGVIVGGKGTIEESVNNFGGGGIYSSGALTVDNIFFCGGGNTTTSILGAALFVIGGSCVVKNGTVVCGNNGLSSVYDFEACTIEIYDSFIKYNRGGCQNLGTLTMDGCSVCHNTSSKFGGVYNSGGSATLTDCDISYNTSLQHGGGIRNEGAILLNDCTVTHNAVTGDNGVGGGISAYTEKQCVLLNTVISDNTADSQGGGVYFGEFNSCFVAGTLITMADGSKKKIEDVSEGDVVMTFDHESGSFSSARVYIAFSEQIKSLHTFKLHFDGGYSVQCVASHCFLEKTSRKYKTFDFYNADEYVGQYFFAEDGQWHELLSVSDEGEAEWLYEIYTEQHQNSFADGMLSVPADVDYSLNLYELDENLKADEAQLQADIEKYGLVSYEYVNANYGMSREWYEACGAKYALIYSGKGLFSLDEALELYSTTDDAAKQAVPTPTLTAFAPMFASVSPLTAGNSTPSLDDFDDKYVTIGSGTKIVNNTAGTDTVAIQNFYTEAGAKINIYGALSDVNVGVTLNGGAGRFTVNGSNDDLKYFTSDEADYTVKYNGDGYIELVSVSELSDDVAGAKYSASLTLNKSIDINFKLKELGDDFALSKLTIVVDNTVIDTVTYSNDNHTVSCVLGNVEPKDIGTPLHIVVVYDNIQTKSFAYSASDYCRTVFGANTDGQYDKLANLCKALLNYGAAMENYVNENDASTLNEGYEYDYSQAIAKGLTDDEILTCGGKITGGAATVIPGSTTSLQFRIYTSEIMTIGRIYIIDDTATYCIPMKNLSMYRDTENGCYVVTVNGIEASKLFKTYRCTYGDIKPEDFSITYSVKDYCCRMASSSSDTRFVKLCKALYYYGYAANEYK